MDELLDPEDDLLDSPGPDISLTTAPIFISATLNGDVARRALYGQTIEEKPPRIVHVNTSASFTTVICGAEDCGLSRSTNVFLENLLVQDARIAPPSSPISAILFHYDPTSTGKRCLRPCEAAYLAIPHPTRGQGAVPPPVTVLVLPTELDSMRRIYSELPAVRVEALHFSPDDLVRQNARFKPRSAEDLDEAHSARLRMLAPCLEDGTTASSISTHFREGALTVVHLCAPSTDAPAARARFDLALGLFMRADLPGARLVALDGAHTYLNATSSFSAAVCALARETGRQRTHLVVAATDITRVPGAVLDACEVLLAHRPGARAWLEHLADHVPVPRTRDMADMLMVLGNDEAVLVAPRALGLGYLRVRPRLGVTAGVPEKVSGPRVMARGEDEDMAVPTETLADLTADEPAGSDTALTDDGKTIYDSEALDNSLVTNAAAGSEPEAAFANPQLRFQPLVEFLVRQRTDVPLRDVLAFLRALEPCPCAREGLLAYLAEGARLGLLQSDGLVVRATAFAPIVNALLFSEGRGRGCMARAQVETAVRTRFRDALGGRTWGQYLGAAVEAGVVVVRGDMVERVRRPHVPSPVVSASGLPAAAATGRSELDEEGRVPDTTRPAGEEPEMAQPMPSPFTPVSAESLPAPVEEKSEIVQRMPAPFAPISADSPSTIKAPGEPASSWPSIQAPDLIKFAPLLQFIWQRHDAGCAEVDLFDVVVFLNSLQPSPCADAPPARFIDECVQRGLLVRGRRWLRATAGPVEVAPRVQREGGGAAAAKLGQYDGLVAHLEARRLQRSSVVAVRDLRTLLDDTCDEDALRAFVEQAVVLGLVVVKTLASNELVEPAPYAPLIHTIRTLEVQGSDVFRVAETEKFLRNRYPTALECDFSASTQGVSLCPGSTISWAAYIDGARKAGVVNVHSGSLELAPAFVVDYVQLYYIGQAIPPAFQPLLDVLEKRLAAGQQTVSSVDIFLELNRERGPAPYTGKFAEYLQGAAERHLVVLFDVRKNVAQKWVQLHPHLREPEATIEEPPEVQEETAPRPPTMPSDRFRPLLEALAKHPHGRALPGDLRLCRNMPYMGKKKFRTYIRDAVSAGYVKDAPEGWVQIP